MTAVRLDRAIDAANDAQRRWAGILSVASVLFFVVMTADAAGFIDLPKFVPEPAKIGVAVVWNAIWWGWLRPKMLRRAQETQHG